MRTPEWVYAGRSCLGQGNLLGLGEVTPELALTAFRNLAWPKPDLVIQPPGGETLVNLATNFYTTLTTPKTQTVTLLGQQITIEATPAEYRFVFDEEGEYLDTKNPGHAYPQLDNTYEYQDAHVTRYPFVWVTYTGRYRVGDGPWTAIPDTLAIRGDSERLRIIEATPRLIAPPD
ncbi:MAG: hypothetical protein ACRCYU_11360 [Nocardioides sp.]